MSDFTLERLQTALSPRQVQYYAQTSSTNDHALDWMEAGAPNGSIVVADEQTKGRGRLGRSWYAPPAEALMFSYVLRPVADALPYVGMMGALVVCEVAESYGVQAGIKWPNDVQIEGRKLCGVLPEASWDGANLVGVALGIGLNVRIDFAGTPFAETAVSLETLVGTVDRLDLLQRLLERLDECSGRLLSDELYAAWRGRLVMLGKRVSINDVDGVAEDVDRYGALLIRRDDGVLHRMVAGDIALG